jgi:hypothetical protein
MYCSSLVHVQVQKDVYLIDFRVADISRCGCINTSQECIEWPWFTIREGDGGRGGMRRCLDFRHPALRLLKHTYSTMWTYEEREEQREGMELLE